MHSFQINQITKSNAKITKWALLAKIRPLAAAKNVKSEWYYNKIKLQEVHGGYFVLAIQVLLKNGSMNGWKPLILPIKVSYRI